MTPKSTERVTQQNFDYACPPDTPAAVVYHASWPDQKIVRGTAGTIAEKAKENGIERTALLVVGGVLDPEKKGHTRSYLYS